MERILISACLIGLRTRYDGSDSFDQSIFNLLNRFTFIPVCPEILGGLSVPRLPATIHGDDGISVWHDDGCVFQKKKVDVTSQFIHGALQTLDFALFVRAKTMILKDGSPSCGVFTTNSHWIAKKGMGITTTLLKENGFDVETIETFLSSQGYSGSVVR
jgi:uncharacterized protein YbbK (DUF523 family)